MRRFAAILCAVAALGAAGCTRAGSPAQHRSDELIVAVGAEPRTLDPLFLSGITAYTVSEIGYSYLTNYDSDGNTIPDAALAVPTTGNGGVSQDGLRVTYHLRHGIRWQDGAPFTSRDVAFTYRAIMNPADTVPSRYGYDRIASVAAPDPYTVIVTMREPYSPIVANFFGGDSNYPILPAHLLAGFRTLAQVPFGNLPVGTGPFAFSKWVRGERISATANPTYFAGKPALQRITLRFIPDVSTTIDELMTGEADATFFADVARIDALRAIPGHRIVVTPVPWFFALCYNVEDPITGDPAVRRAFSMAIDRTTLVRKISHGLFDASTGARGLFTWAYDPAAGRVPYDPRAAAALLERDGWHAGPDGIRSKNGRRLEIQIAFYSGSSIEAEFVPAIAAAERAAGIDVTTKRYSREEILQVDGPLFQGRYQVALYNFQATWDPDSSWLLACDQRGPNGFNLARYCNPTVDRSLAIAARSFDRALRVREYRSVQRQLLADLPYDFLCQVAEVDVIPSGLQGYDRPLLSPFNSIARWRLQR